MIYYYKDFEEDFVTTKKQGKKIPNDYQWIKRNPFQIIFGGVMFRILKVYGYFYSKIVLHLKIEGKEKIYVCPNIDSQVLDCNEIKDCTKLSYDDTNEETKFECSKEIITNVEHCLNFERIMMKDNCNKYINESFEFKFCPDLSGSSNSTYSSNSSRINFINLFILLFILLLLII